MEQDGGDWFEAIDRSIGPVSRRLRESGHPEEASFFCSTAGVMANIAATEFLGGRANLSHLIKRTAAVWPCGMTAEKTAELIFQ